MHMKGHIVIHILDKTAFTKEIEKIPKTYRTYFRFDSAVYDRAMAADGRPRCSVGDNKLHTFDDDHGRLT